jgi:DMSO/TMAO reductase YedYZ molybdopterin-dependent catalytic subunit
MAADSTPTSALSVDRRGFLKAAGILAAGSAIPGWMNRALAAEDTAILPFGNGEREMATYPQKRPLIRFSARPPQLETPFSVFDHGTITPNDAFFVRYHLAGIPTSIDPAAYRLRIRGAVEAALELSLGDLRRISDPVELVAVNQCSGNSRGFFSPRVAGGQLGNGAMGCARWTGVPLKRLLEKAGLAAGAKQVAFEGLDRPVLPATPEFVKALDVDHALDGEVMLAYAMNGEDLPMLNGYPVRLVVPGYFGTYWVKHLADINVLTADCTSFWMTTAYRVPDNTEHSVPPGQAPAKTVPIGRFAIRSFITSPRDGDRIPAGRDTLVRGIAFDAGYGLRSVEFSGDGGRSWTEAAMGPDMGRYAFRRWSTTFRPEQPGPIVLKVRATNRAGEAQPPEPRWNPAGYMRNVVESVNVEAVS